MTIIDKAGACAALAGALLLGASAHAVTPAQKCQEAKLKAQGKLQLCLKKNSAKLVGGKPDGSATCQAKFSAALTKAGTACRYLDNGDGTVSDLNTGLMWEQKTNDASVHDEGNSYTWSSDPGSTVNFNGTAFTNFMPLLNTSKSAHFPTITGCFANYCDWRLPTIVELLGIVDLSRGACNGGSGACIDPTFGPTEPGWYLSSTTVDPDTSTVLVVVSDTGGVDDQSCANPQCGGYVRAVRGGL